MKCDIIIQNCSILTPDFEIRKDVSVVIDKSLIIDIDDHNVILNKYKSVEIVQGKGKLLMPGLVDGHTHTCQALLRGRTSDEYPMIWTRILVPFESNLNEEDVYFGAKLSILEMIKSGTTSFADSGGVHMHKVGDAVIESGMRAAIARSTMDMGDAITGIMKEKVAESISRTEELYKAYNSKGEGRLDVWFAIRQIMTCSPELIRTVAEKAQEYSTGIHAHLSEHRDEVSFCLQNYKKRPAEFLNDMGALGPNLLTAHNVVLSESDITLLKEKDVKIIHCPRANLGNHGFTKTPRMLEAGLSIGLGTDGGARVNLSLFDEMKILRYAMIAYWGLPIFDPVVLRCKELLKMVTIGGANAINKADIIGTIEVGKKADVILINLNQPHLTPTQNLINTIAENAGSHDVTDSIINGKIVMRDREVLTIDEEETIYECEKRMNQIISRVGI